MNIVEDKINQILKVDIVAQWLGYYIGVLLPKLGCVGSSPGSASILLLADVHPGGQQVESQAFVFLPKNGVMGSWPQTSADRCSLVFSL